MIFKNFGTFFLYKLISQVKTTKPQKPQNLKNPKNLYKPNSQRLMLRNIHFFQLVHKTRKRESLYAYGNYAIKKTEIIILFLFVFLI